MDINATTERIIGAAITVHRELGPGLLESTYQKCLVHELVGMGVAVQRQVPIPIHYKGTKLDCGYRIDLLVERCVIVELKTVDRFDPIHIAQVLTYLKLSGNHVGLLFNFNVRLLRDGLRRIVLNHLPPARTSAPSPPPP
jgi:GxxExxY protein